MKAKQLCPCSPCSYVWTLGLALVKVHFIDEWQNFVHLRSACPSDTNESLSLHLIVLVFVLDCCVSLQPIFLSQQK